MVSQIDLLHDLIAQRKVLSVDIYETMKRAFPVDSCVTFKKWGHVINAQIIAHNNYGERIFVRSETGKQYWIDLFWLL